MKELFVFVLLVTLIGFIATICEQKSVSYKISNPSVVGATVVASIQSIKDGYAHITLSSNESRKRVNVTLRILTANGSKTDSVGVNPNQSSVAKIYIGKRSNDQDFNLANCSIKITDAQCSE